MIEIAALAGDQRICNANAVSASDELLREMRPDEAGAAGDQELSHKDLWQSPPDTTGERDAAPKPAKAGIGRRREP
jgi:hypothetical protein